MSEHRIRPIHFPVVPVTPTHQLRLLTGSQAGQVFVIAFERVRIGRTHQDKAHEFWIDDVVMAVGRGMHVFSDGKGGHQIEQVSVGAPPYVNGRTFRDCGAQLCDDTVVKVADVLVAYERLGADPQRVTAKNYRSRVRIEPEWLTPTVTAIAREIHTSGSFDQLPILADALQDAGCEHEHLLSHCRLKMCHSHGCWAADVVLEAIDGLQQP